jgi:dihydroorotate dehydrogenase (NAD+) catalytic subunit
MTTRCRPNPGLDGVSARLAVRVGRVALKNPLIAAPAEHFIDPEGPLKALRAGAAAIVVKSTNESQAAREQLDRAEYVALDAAWNPVPWGPDAPAATTIACRSGLTPEPFEVWLDRTAALDRAAKELGAYAVASLILSELEPATAMARAVEAAGLRVLEFNIGTPYASQAAKNAVSTVLDPARVTTIVTAIRAAITIPLWVKLSGQSEQVPELARAAFAAGADSVTMAGRSLGLIPDLETQAPLLGTSLGIGGYWNLPLTCHWLALTRAALGPERSLVGTNGAQSGLDVARMMLAGASAVAIATPVMLRGARLIEASLAELDGYLAGKGMDAAGIVGLAADRRKTFAEMPPRPGNWRRYVTP